MTLVSFLKGKKCLVYCKFCLIQPWVSLHQFLSLLLTRPQSTVPRCYAMGKARRPETHASISILFTGRMMHDPIAEIESHQMTTCHGAAKHGKVLSSIKRGQHMFIGARPCRSALASPAHAGEHAP